MAAGDSPPKAATAAKADPLADADEDADSKPQAKDPFEMWEDMNAEITEWKTNHMPKIKDETADIMWKQSIDLCKAKIEEPIATARDAGEEVTDPSDLARSVAGDKFSGKMTADKKRELQLEYGAMLYGFAHARKKLKFGGEFIRRTTTNFDKFNASAEEEFIRLKSECARLKRDNQNSVHQNHLAIDKIKTKDETLKLVALSNAAHRMAFIKRTHVTLFDQVGLAISKKLLTAKPHIIGSAKDFGPNSKVAGQPFFEMLFQELSKSSGHEKADGMKDIENHKAIYNDNIDKKVAADKKNPLTGHPLDTADNRTLIWYGDTSRGVDSIAQKIVRAFNAHRSDEASKKLRPVIGKCIAEFH